MGISADEASLGKPRGTNVNRFQLSPAGRPPADSAAPRVQDARRKARHVVSTTECPFDGRPTFAARGAGTSNRDLAAWCGYGVLAAIRIFAGTPRRPWPWAGGRFGRGTSGHEPRSPGGPSDGGLRATREPGRGSALGQRGPQTFDLRGLDR